MPADWIRSFVAKRSGLRLEEDRWGNLLVKYPGRSRPKSPPVVMVAHLDHPGFVVTDVRGESVGLEFRGGVHLRHARRGTALDFYRVGSKRPIGRGRLTSTSDVGGRRPGMLSTARARITRGRAEAGGFTMWPFPGYAVRGGRVVSRCLDDLIGVAAALATLDDMHRRRPRGAHVWGFFTRAEEIGFFGTMAGIRSRVVPKNARVISLEASRILPTARLGDGVIVRVGDGRSLFDPRLMGVLHRESEALAADDPDFRAQRKLMDGGACEATAFCAAGYRCGGLTLPLGNYHNMSGLDGGRRGIGPEFIRVSDFVSEVKLLVRLAERSRILSRLEEETEAWVDDLTKRAMETLQAAPLEVRGGSR